MQTLGLPILQMRKEAQALETTSPRLHEWLKAEPQLALNVPGSTLSYQGPPEPSG